jgi:hypothetical protein
MKKILILFVSIFFLVVILGFMGIGIPLGKEKKIKEIVIGERKTQDGKVIEQILKHEGLKNYFFVMSFDGPGKKHQSFNEYYLKRGENKIRLSHLSFTPQEYDVLRPALPVQESKKWIAAQLSRVDRDEVDVELTVFDEQKIYRTLIAQNCVRTSTSINEWNDLSNYGITAENENAKIVFHTNNGEYVFDVVKDTFEKK